VGARALAVGHALAARPSPDAVFVNPAGLARLRGDQFVVHHATNVAGDATALSLLFAREAIGTLGLSYQLLDAGEIESTDEAGNVTGVLALRDHMLWASFATPISRELAAGFNYKLYRLSATCTRVCGEDAQSGTTHAVDVGVQYRPGWLPSLEVGVSVVSLGFPLQVVNAAQADELPTRLRVGAAYNVLGRARPDTALALWISLEVSQSVRDPGRRIPSIGVELAVRDAVFLRAGHAGGEGLEGWTAIGLGVQHQRFTVGVAKPFGVSGLDSGREPFQVSFGVAL